MNTAPWNFVREVIYRSRHREGIQRAYRYLRGAILRRVWNLQHVSRTAVISGGCQINEDFAAGEFSYLGPGCRIGPRVEIGNYVMLGPGVLIVGSDHRWDVPGVPMIFSGRPALPRTVIEADCWVGARTIILAGVRVGSGSIVGAGSVVTKDLAPYGIYAGVPARKIRNRFESVEDRRLHETMLADLPKEGAYCPPMWANSDRSSPNSD